MSSLQNHRHCRHRWRWKKYIQHIYAFLFYRSWNGAESNETWQLWRYICKRRQQCNGKTGLQIFVRQCKLQREVEKANICFMHAPLFHPALKTVAPIRKNIGLAYFFQYARTDGQSFTAYLPVSWCLQSRNGTALQLFACSKAAKRLPSFTALMATTKYRSPTIQK